MDGTAAFLSAARHPLTDEGLDMDRAAPAPTPTPSGLSQESRRLAGTLLVVFPTVVYGGVSLLRLLLSDPAYAENPLRRELWRAGHAHAGVLLILALVALRYVDECRLPARLRGFVRHAIPAGAILLPAAFFLSVLSPDAAEPNRFILLAFVGAPLVAVGLLLLGVGLLRGGRDR